MWTMLTHELMLKQMKKINFKKILIAVFIGVGFVSAGNVEAKTAKWISSSMPQLYYYATPSLQSQELLSAYGGQEADTSDPGSGWFPLVTNGKLEVGYSAYVWIKPCPLVAYILNIFFTPSFITSATSIYCVCIVSVF